MSEISFMLELDFLETSRQFLGWLRRLTIGMELGLGNDLLLTSYMDGFFTNMPLNHPRLCLVIARIGKPASLPSAVETLPHIRMVSWRTRLV